ncbi:NAD(P)-binding protein [Hypoxylon trugodes]|uniref:NAD(P)-binding protein n=1 Tax=Hypoxylon trugodes TaxID=326681 RepID=UPI002190D7D6|nr:NAD(P)-binding protein [Hypoxylon trugodes]KAI1392961.1 NAD(P)-binding protein [Hypoxylon trugodes]
MSLNILITGAAGYIGGSVLAELLSRTSGLVKAKNIIAAVRSEEQVQSLSKLGVNVVQLNLRDEDAVKEVVLKNNINFIIHTASSSEAALVSHLIKALGEHRRISGKDAYFIHSSLTTLFSEEAGWTYGEVRDSDPIFEKEKEIGDLHPARHTNILVAELSKELGVTSFNVAVPMVYGRGAGEWRKVSVNIPASIRTAIANKIVYKFDKDGAPPATHISDLAALYALLVEKVTHKEPIPSGEKGYYFATVHKCPWWEVMDGIAKSMHERGLVAEPKAQLWPSYELAADQLGFPRRFIRAMATSSGDLVPVNSYNLGWQPKWDQERFLNSLDEEVQTMLEVDTVKPTIFDFLLNN